MTGTTSRQSVLVVDDTPANLHLLHQILGAAGYDVRVAVNGKMALASVAAEVPDLILLDVVMPEQDGFQVLADLRCQPGGRDIPVIFVSALDNAEQKLAAFRAGGVDYITKPFQAAEVLARVETHLQLQAASRALLEANRRLRRKTDQLRIIGCIQSDLIAQAEAAEMYRRVLAELQRVTQSPLGLCAEFARDERGPLYRVTVGSSLRWSTLGSEPSTPAEPIEIRSWGPVISEVIRSKDILVLNEMTDAPRRDDLLAGHATVRHVLGIPLRRGEAILGVLALVNREGGYDDALVEFLRPIAAAIAQVIGARHAVEARNHAERELERIAHVDGLTGIPNRRSFDTALDLQWRQLQRCCKPLTLLMADIDYFKAYNDLYGHQSGDACLRSVARVFHNAMRRAGDLAGRYGGEEFACVLGNTPHEGGLLLAERILRDVRALAITHEASPVDSVVTVSIGVVTCFPGEGCSQDEIVAAADACLYQAKSQGRARVVGNVSE